MQEIMKRLYAAFGKTCCKCMRTARSAAIDQFFPTRAPVGDADTFDGWRTPSSWSQ